jgi:hydrogenase nickel incorporation protein HypA/HybF
VTEKRNDGPTTVWAMHEVGIARSVIDAAISALPEGATLSGVTVAIGPMSGVVGDSLQFGFEVASKGTAAEGAELEIVEVPLELRCPACETAFEVQDAAIIRCPICDGPVDVLSGNATLVTAVRYSED